MNQLDVEQVAAVPVAHLNEDLDAANAARTLIRYTGLRGAAAATTTDHGSNGVTGESDPNANATPVACIAPIGLLANARRTPSRSSFMERMEERWRHRRDSGGF